MLLPKEYLLTPLDKNITVVWQSRKATSFKADITNPQRAYNLISFFPFSIFEVFSLLVLRYNLAISIASIDFAGVLSHYQKVGRERVCKHNCKYHLGLSHGCYSGEDNMVTISVNFNVLHDKLQFCS